MQIFSDKPVKMPKNTAMVVYPVQAILLNVSMWKTQLLIDNGHTLVAFLLVCCGDEQVDEERNGEGEEVSTLRFTSSCNTL